MSESALWNEMSSNLPGLRLKRIDPKLDDGVPDVYGRSRADDTSFWVELKYVREKDVYLGFKPNQLIWLREEIQHGGRAFGLVKIYSGRYLILPASLQRGWNAELLKPISQIDFKSIPVFEYDKTNFWPQFRRIVVQYSF